MLTCKNAGQRVCTRSLPSWSCGFDSRHPLRSAHKVFGRALRPMISTKASAPLKYSGSSLLAAVTAIVRSEARLRGSRPDARTAAQIWPKSRAAP